MSLTQATDVRRMEWTGERMVPHASDALTELYHWQRYLFFRPWYEGKRVIDAASGEGYGSNYASTFAESVTGYDIAEDAVRHSTERYPNAEFLVSDVCTSNYATADLVVSFETIEHLPDPVAFLRALRSCEGTIVISTPNRNTHSPGNQLTDKPFNTFHTVEWTPTEFAELIQSEFPDREVRFLSQQMAWPGLIQEGLDDNAMYCLAVIGDGEIPQWPSIGVSIPTCNGSDHVTDAFVTFTRSYPGRIEFCIVSNGCDEENRSKLSSLAEASNGSLHVIYEPENRGYGVGTNIGLEYLHKKGGFDFLAVSNDDVIPAIDCIAEMVNVMIEAESMGLNPGVVGPVSNYVSGPQLVDIGQPSTIEEVYFAAENRHRIHHNSATPTNLMRGLFMLFHPRLIETVGGFDPRFGLGNAEDNDHNIRTRLAGFSMWIADGAFLYHHGSSTFQRLNIDYQASIDRTHTLFGEKWGAWTIEDIDQVQTVPEGESLYIPLSSRLNEPSGYFLNFNGTDVDLVNEATPVEFGAWIAQMVSNEPRSIRTAVIQALIQETAKQAA